MFNFIHNTEMRVLPALISFIMLMFFVSPFASGIVNLGNIFGAVVSTILLLIFVFYGHFKSIISSLWSKPIGKALVLTAAAGTILFSIAAVTISVFMVKAINDQPKNADTTLVVLGCKVKNGAPSRMLRKRLDAAYDYLADNPEVCVIVSGGKGDDEIISESECMRDYLKNKGIDEKRIFIEDKSVNTEQNLRFSKEIIDSEKLPESITIVTDGYHQMRSKMIADKLGIENTSISASTSWWLVPTYWVREWFGIPYYAVKNR